jgi:hypothetical protein
MVNSEMVVGNLCQIISFDRPTRMGTATPNFGQAGDGVEVLFGNGAKNGSNLSFMIDASASEDCVDLNFSAT